ncbi:hypothetical protein SUGI_1026780 [Cryptomeria japonica]|nr:hypothetical protein SUGI_1026780 [Cryptomeria japonica]
MLEAILVVFSSVGLIYASDPDILTDFTILVWQFSNLTGSYFTFKGFRDVGTNNLTGPVKVTKAVAAEFPALNGLGVSMAMLQFPVGLLHYQLNADATYKALVVSAFRSANAGTMSVPSTLFTTGIPDDVLAKSFKTNTQAIELLKSGLKST